ncbi:MAG TPA: TIGR03086 family metal-binding protein [Iamia sp.]|nr:TIGR03086 family metal-binding protein [Iamia sp.]
MTAPMISPAAATFVSIVDGIADDRLGAATPCPDYDVAGLVGHLLHRGPQLVGAATKEVVPAAAPEPADPATWRAELLALVDRLDGVWSQPEAWEGSTRVEGPMEMPASTIGGIVLAEMVVHGWDLARATGQNPIWPGPLLDTVHQDMAAMAPMGRKMGAFGPEVEIPADAPTIARLLGVVGRDPAWTP